MDILEPGVPFSDSLAYGLANQLAARRGLESGATPPKVLETIAAILKFPLFFTFTLSSRS